MALANHISTYKLDQEREFITRAQGIFSVLTPLGDNEISGAAPPRTAALSALDELLFAASAIQAKAIVRLAASVKADIIRETPQAATNSLRRLRHLVSQYAGGLFEIDPEYARQFDASAAAAVPQQFAQPPTLSSGARDNDAVLENRAAAAVLNSLSALGVAAPHRTAFAALSRLSSEQCKTAAKDRNINRSHADHERFDRFMSELANDVLAHVRASGAAQISLSFGGELLYIAHEPARLLRPFLHNVMCLIAKNGLREKDGRRVINLSGSGTPEQGAIAIDWTGYRVDKAGGETAESVKYGPQHLSIPFGKTTTAQRAPNESAGINSGAFLTQSRL